MMIDAPFGESGVLIFPMNVSTKRSIGLEASHGMRGRRVDISLGKGGREMSWTEGGARVLLRRGVDIAVNRCGGETNDMVMEEERQGVGQRSGGESARVPVGVAVTEEKGGADRGGRQAEKGRDTQKDVMV